MWARQTMANYRPDDINYDYYWRYAQTVHAEVGYSDPVCDQMPGICNGYYSMIPAAGGVCGPRAFWSRMVRKAFGIPTWGVTQPGHAAMTTFSPVKNWHVLLGADWKYSWWGNRGGPDFHLETQTRETRPAYQQALRMGWAARARGDAPVNPDWGPEHPEHTGQGGLWSALTLYAMKWTVNQTSPLPPRHMGPSVVPTKVQRYIDASNQTWPKPNITVDGKGNVHIPAAALTYKNKSASIITLKSFDLQGQQLVHENGDYFDPTSTSFGYSFDMPEAGKRYLTVNISTWHMNLDLMYTLNGNTTLSFVPIYYTVGWWNQTQPLELDLVKGNNTLMFMRSTEKPIAFKVQGGREEKREEKGEKKKRTAMGASRCKMERSRASRVVASPPQPLSVTPALLAPTGVLSHGGQAGHSQAAGQLHALAAAAPQRLH